MKKIKVFALPSHQTEERTSGVDFARVIQPMKHLHGWKDEDVEFEVTVYDMTKQTTEPDYFLDIAKNHDIIFFNYIANPWGFAHMGAYARKFGTKLIMDLDDDLWDIRDDNPTASFYKKGSAELNNLSAIIDEVDHVVVTNDYLKHVVMNHTNKKAKDITAINNFIDLDLYNYHPEFKDEHYIHLVYFGSTTHYKDLNEDEFNKALDRILSEYPNVDITTIGVWLPRLSDRWGQRYLQENGARDIYDWISGRYREVMAKADIVLSPLINDIYNRSKSGIKYLEYSAAGKPGVYADMRQYQEYITHGEDGYLALNDKGWYKYIKELLDDKEKRRSVGEKAYERVQEETIQKNVYRYGELFKKLIDNETKKV